MASNAPSDAATAVTDGPVMNLINKRIRNYRKKLNRIANMEESLAQGKTLNNEQLEVLRSKNAIVAQIDELEKLKAPLATALSEELNGGTVAASAESKENEKVVKDEGNGVVEDVLRLVYFGTLFDVKSPGDFNSVMLTRSHERGCCLTYDCVTDDDASAADLLGEKDLDLISMLGGLLVSRPVDSNLSHKNALERCVKHAKLWLTEADQPIDSSNAGITYASLRDRLNKIMSSDYFTTIPEMKAPDEVAAAAGNYATFQVPVQEVSEQQEDQHKEEESAEAQHSEAGDNPFNPEETNKDEVEAENLGDFMQEQEEMLPQAEEDYAQKNGDFREQQYFHRRPYQNQRGRGGGRRGFYNGRGGRGGGRRGGGYQNGRHQYYDQQEYYQRNYYRERGGMGPGHSYNNHARSVQGGQAANGAVAS